MREDELLLYLKVLFAVAWADSSFGPEEAELLSSILDGFNASDTVRDAVRTWRASPVTEADLAELDLEGLPEEQRIHLSLLASAVAKADGFVARGEDDLLGRLTRRLGVGNDLPTFSAELERDLKLFGLGK